MARGPHSVADWIQRQLKNDAPRSRSLIVTIFGDSVAPYVDGIWLSSLIELMAPFGANERLVRTSVFRLTEQGWLVATREGRRSYYTLAPGGRRRFRAAYDRVYKLPSDWDGNWTWVVLPKSENGVPARVELRKELEFEGYGVLGPGLFLRPGANEDSLKGILEELKLSDRAMVMRAKELPSDGRATHDVISQCWDLQPVTAAYLQFLDGFRPIQGLIENGAAMSPEQAFVVQSLLIDAFRRVTIHDPRLPAPLLSKEWPGQQAFQTCRQIYRKTYRPAREHLIPKFESQGGALPKFPAEFEERFGGLR